VHGDCDNYLVLKGHKNAVLDLQWAMDGTQVVTGSSDETVRVW
jgi:Prp8 binding protein